MGAKKVVTGGVRSLRVVFLGPPGSGKGTQASVVSSRMGLAHVATGDMLRANVKEGTELGQKAEGFMKAGKLVPDDLVMEMLFGRLGEKDCKLGWILDGFPRNKAQADSLEQRGCEAMVAINFQIEDEALVKRVTGRLVCGKCGTNFHKEFRQPQEAGKCDACGGELVTRKDDNEETVRERLKVYQAEIQDLVEHYRRHGVLKEINADRAPEEITDELLSLLQEAMPSSE